MDNYSLKQKLFPRALLLFTLIFACVVQSHAVTVTIDNINYSISDSANTAIVTGLEDRSLTTELVIPDSIEYDGQSYAVTEIWNRAFFYSGLTSVIIPNSVTRIRANAFSDCTELTSVTLSSSLTSIELSVFDGCTGLTSVTIPESVTKIGNSAFYGCTGLTSVIIPDSVISIGNCSFYGCTGMASVVIGNSVTEIGHDAFSDCTGLTSVVIGNSVSEIIYNAFKGCTGLTSVSIPDSVTKIEFSAFEGCTGLTSVVIGNSVSKIGSQAFASCTSLQEFIVDSNNAYFATDSSGALYNKEFTKIVSCPGGKTDFDIPGSVTELGEYSFYGCSGLSSIIIPNSVTTISYQVFQECTGLTSVTCLWDVPLSASTPVFSSETYEKCRLYVPIGKESAYADVVPWSNFSQIIGVDLSSVSEIYGDSTGKISVENGAISINADTDARIVSMSGAIVYSGRGATRINVAPGVYIVIINNTATKMIVK